MVVEFPAKTFKVPGDALFLETAAASDPDTGIILDRSRNFQAVKPQGIKAELAQEVQGFRREAAACKVLPKPVTDSGRAVLWMNPADKDAARKIIPAGSFLKNAPAGSVTHLGLHLPGFQTVHNVFDGIAIRRPGQEPQEMLAGSINQAVKTCRIRFVQRSKNHMATRQFRFGNFVYDFLHAKDI